MFEKLTTKISDTFNTAKENIEHTFDEQRIKMISKSQLHFDEDYKALFIQEPEKVDRIEADMRIHGFDKSMPIIATKDFSILDGNSRYMAACRINEIKFVPVVIKEFDTKDEALKYALHLQLDRRNLTDSEIFLMFKRFEEMKMKAKISGKTTEEYSDAKIAEQLQKSERQVQKMRELAKKVDSLSLKQITDGRISINKAYAEMKKKEAVLNVSDKIQKQSNPKTYEDGIRFALDQIAKGKTPEEILSAI